MIKQDLLDYELHLDGKHIADFDNIDDAKSFAFPRVDCGYADCAVVVCKWTGEIVYHLFAKLERKVVEE